MPLVRACPKTHSGRRPYQGHSPQSCSSANGRAKPCLTSGGEAEAFASLVTASTDFETEPVQLPVQIHFHSDTNPLRKLH